ncbi:hypothetical protein [Thermogymnomonas acidicola]|uniref:flavoprotein n=1 Tax=Thermogymnomonas acidicola TaxID=399579 RepID=UPI000946159B|nr:flavoprotein [Thermogymnomonas acidicola]
MSRPPRRGINTGCLEGRRILVATGGGSISIYRVPDIIREMRREGGAKVKVAMGGKASQALISHEVFRWASGNDVITEVSGRLEHISDVEGSDALVLMPASFDTIGKCANGIADEVQPLMFSNAVGSGVPVLFVPAMHQGMFRSPALRRNTDILRSMGALFVEPVVEEGKAKLAGPAEVIDAVARALAGQRGGGRYLVVSGRGGEEVIDQ